MRDLRSANGLVGLCWASGKRSVVVGLWWKGLVPDTIHRDYDERGLEIDDDFLTFQWTVVATSARSGHPCDSALLVVWSLGLFLDPSMRRQVNAMIYGDEE